MTGNIHIWLSGWKEVSSHIGKSIKTCKRYKKKYSMPVKYLPGGRLIALSIEIDQWLIKFNEIKMKSAK